MAADEELVATAVRGDPAGFAAIYDRYADRIHDYARSVLRNDADAADVTQDTFLAASQRLGQLRDPSKLRPWLYAIARSFAFRIIKSRQRVEVSDDVDEVVEMTGPEGAIDARELVWAATAGLEASDRDILDLHLRQGLDGQDLAEALGVTPNAANVALHRVRERMEQSVGAVLLARTSAGECGELDRLVADGLSPLVRKRVARHVASCEICSERQSTMTSPTALFAATPLALAPVALREQVLGQVGTPAADAAADALPWQPDGFPDSSGIRPPVDGGAGAGRGPGSVARAPRPLARLLAVAASAALVIGGGLFLLTRDSADDDRLAAPAPTSIDTIAAPAGDPDDSDPVEPSPTVASAPDESAPPSATTTPATTEPTSPTTTATTTSTTTTTTEPPAPTSTVIIFPSVTLGPGELAPPTAPTITVVDFDCGPTMTVVVDVSPSAGVTGTFEWAVAVSSDPPPLVPVGEVAGRFTASLTIAGEFVVTPSVSVTGPGGSRTEELDDCIVIE